MRNTSVDTDKHVYHAGDLSEKMFKAVAESATDSIVIADEDSIILYCNNQALELFGYEEEELIGQNLTILMPVKYHEAHSRGMRRFVESGKPKIIGKTVELSAVKKNKKEFPIELSLSAWKEGAHYFFAGIIRDATEKHKTLKEMEMLQSISAAISKSDNFNTALSQTIKIICQETGWNCGEAWVLNRRKRKVEYAPVWYLSDEKYRPFLEESEKLSFRVGEGMTGKVFLNKIEWAPDISVSIDFKRKDLAGKVGLKSGFGVPVVTHEGEVFASMMFYFSETKERDTGFTNLVSSLANQLGTFLEKKQTEERLKQSRDFYLTILEDFPALIWRTDIDGETVYFNRTWIKFTGTCREDELNKGWEYHIHKDDQEKVVGIYEKAAKDRDVFEMEYRLRRHDGQYRWILNFGRPFFDVDSNFKGYLGVCYDITDQKRALDKLNRSYSELRNTTEELMETEGKLNELNSELEKKVDDRTKDLNEKNENLLKINRDLDNFIYTASHDLKAPIANMEGLTNMLHDAISETNLEDSSQISSVIGMIDDSVSRLKNTIGDLTEISKVHRMEKEDIGPQNISDIIEDSKVLLSGLLKESEAEIHLDMHQCPLIEFSKRDMRSVIMNLLSNAMKFRLPDRKPEIFIECHQEGDQAILSVKDNGIGIDLKKFKLFKMFKRYNTQVEGTGIGLYIIKRIIDDAGGRIEVESEVDEGTTFKIYFNIQQ